MHAPTKPKVSVVIPTYYPEPAFLEVLEQVSRQLTSCEADIVIVDSRKDGRASPVIEQAAKRFPLRLEVIDAKHFEHGDTRNLGVSLTNADYIAFLTQDALPASEYWLESLVAPLRIIPGCAYSFGRHRAYGGQHPLYEVEMDEFFDGLGALGFVASRRMDARRYDSDPVYRANLCFNSDNNAAYRGDLIRSVRFPAVKFAEDQAVARRFLDQGLSRAYAGGAVVFHSHDYTRNLGEAYRRGTEEGEALLRNFGIMRYRTVADYRRDLDVVTRMVRAKAAARGLGESSEEAFVAAKRAYMKGALEYCLKQAKVPGQKTR